MMRIAVHTRVLADRIAEYEAAHREVPAEPTAAIRSAGAKRSSIWRSGIEQFHLIGCEDCARLLAELEGLSVSVAWQTQMAGLPDVAHDYSAAGAGLPEAWRLPEDRPQT
jgi:L-rhamnose mutarotase